MRVIQHITDTKAVKKVLSTIPDEWVIRELSERDYGIDLMIEVFEKFDVDRNGNDVFTSTGHIGYFQIKGVSKKISISKNDEVGISIPKKTLLYVEKFATPFFLVYVSTTHDQIYFLWLQRYISDVLDVEEPNWRKKRIKKKKTSKASVKIRVYIPSHNKLSKKDVVFQNRLAKIAKICSRIKYLEELSEYHERFKRIQSRLNPTSILNAYSDIIFDIKRLRKLNTLLKYNTSCISDNDLIQLQNYVSDIKAAPENYNASEKSEDFHNLEVLLKSTEMVSFLEELAAESEKDTVY